MVPPIPLRPKGRNRDALIAGTCVFLTALLGHTASPPLALLLAAVLGIAVYIIMKRLERHRRAHDNAAITLATVSHEMRTPMHAIMNYAAMGEKALDNGRTEDLRRYLGNIQHGVKRQVDLLNHLLDLGKLELGTAAVQRHETNLHDTMTRSLEEIGSLIADKNLQLHIHGHSNTDTHPTPHDRRLMMQLFINLLSNAIRFSPEGGTIDIAYTRDAHNMRCSIANEGPPILPSEVESIFAPFVRGSAADADSTGLGLAICQSIATAHKGRIWAEARDKGAVFHLVLPV